MSIKMNKKAMELQTSFIVTLVITLIVFAGTLGIAMKVLKGADKLKQGLDKQTEERLESMVTSGNEEVVIAFNKKESKQGEPVVFGVGVLNTLGVEKNFTLTVSKSIAVNADGTEISPGWESGWRFIPQDSFGSVKNNAYSIKSIVIIPPDDAVMSATYTFDVQVFYDTALTKHYPATNYVKKIRIVIV